MSRAAEQLHVSQPTLSKTLKALEEELGKKLFIRHSFSISLTDEGMLLRDRAQDLVAMSDKIEQEFNSLDDITGGDIYFGLAESYQIRYLAREIYKLKEKYPNFTYHITSGDTGSIIKVGGVRNLICVQDSGYISDSKNHLPPTLEIEPILYTKKSIQGCSLH
jgi:DNA-binding transcriptional LysR family regulator